MAASRVTLVVKDSDYFKKVFEIDADASMQMLYDRFSQYVCKKCSVADEKTCFTYEGHCIQRQSTANSIGLRDGETVYVRALYTDLDEILYGARPLIGHEACSNGITSLAHGFNLHYLDQPLVKDIPN